MAIDGVDGAGKTHFADALAQILGARGHRVLRASTDDFHHPRAHRHALGRTPDSVWSRHFDYRAMRTVLLDPWLAGPGSAYQRAAHDVATDQAVVAPTEVVPAAGVLLVDGVFVQRAELVNAWDFVVFLEVPFDVSVARMALRDGTVDDADHPDQRRYVEAQRTYFAECDPQGSADVVVDNSDLARPTMAPSFEAPAGWAVHGEELTREVRLPTSAVATALVINRLLGG